MTRALSTLQAVSEAIASSVERKNSDRRRALELNRDLAAEWVALHLHASQCEAAAGEARNAWTLAVALAEVL